MRNKVLRITVLTIVVFCVVSCAPSTKEFVVDWILLTGDIDVEIEMKFRGTNEEHSKDIFLIPNETTLISIPYESMHFGTYIYGVQQLYDYPLFNHLPNGGSVELYLFSPPKVKKVSDTEFQVEEKEGVVGYSVVYERDGKVYYVISKDNTLTLNRFSSSAIRPNDLIQHDYQDTYVELKFASGDTGGKFLSGGYIVQSKLDGNHIWLNKFPVSNEWK